MKDMIEICRANNSTAKREMADAGCRLCLLVLVRPALHGGAHGILGKTALQHETHLLAARGRIFGNGAEFAPPHFFGARQSGRRQFGFQFSLVISLDTMLLKFGDYPAVAVAAGPTVHQRFGKAFLRQPIVLFEEVEQRLDVVAFLGITGQLASQLEPAVLAH